MGFFEIWILGKWDYLWDFRKVGFCESGIMGKWDFGKLGLWESGILGKGDLGKVDFGKEGSWEKCFVYKLS